MGEEAVYADLIAASWGRWLRVIGEEEDWETVKGWHGCLCEKIAVCTQSELYSGTKARVSNGLRGGISGILAMKPRKCCWCRRNERTRLVLRGGISQRVAGALVGSRQATSRRAT